MGVDHPLIGLQKERGSGFNVGFNRIASKVIAGNRTAGDRIGINSGELPRTEGRVHSSGVFARSEVVPKVSERVTRIGQRLSQNDLARKA